MMQPSIILRRVMCIKSIEKIGITVTNSTTFSFNRISISIKVMQFSVNKTIVFDISIDVQTNHTDAMYHPEIPYDLPIFSYYYLNKMN